MPIENRVVSLREIEASDLPQLHAWRNDSCWLLRCSHRRTAVSFEEFVAELENDFNFDRHLQMVIELISSKESIGTIWSYGYRPDDSIASVSIFLAEKFRLRGFGIYAMFLFLQHLFDKYELFKVYTDVYSYNRESLSLLDRFGFVREGTFADHRLADGKRYDLIRFALFRSQLANVQLRMCELIPKLQLR